MSASAASPHPDPAARGEGGAWFVAALLQRGLTEDSRRPAVITDGHVMRYGELMHKVLFAAAHLARLGLGPGHRLALILPPGPAMLPVLLGALHRGLLVSVLSSSLGPAARTHRLAQFQPDLVLEEPDDLPCLHELVGLAPPRSPGAALVLWTSGTSGLPRAVVLTLEAVLWNARRNAEVLRLVPSDRTMVVLDSAYCYALIHQIFSHLRVGAAVVMPTISPAQQAQLGPACARLQITTLAVVPSILRLLIELPWLGATLQKLRLLTVGGAATPEGLLLKASRALPQTELYVTYGLTEAGPRVCTRRYCPEAAADPGSVGVPLPGVQVRVDEEGELWVRSPSARLGYLSHGQLEASGPFAEWVRTGDRAEVEPSGSVRILGRIRPIINRAGVKVPPAEIERVLEAHPAVARARVVAMPHGRLGDVPRAYVVPRPGLKPCPVALMGHCRDLLGPAFAPAQVDLVAQLPQDGASWKAVEPDGAAAR